MNELRYQRFKYEQFGNGPVKLVLVHHFGGSADSWKWTLKKLSKKISAITITMPGFGLHQPLEEPSIYEYANHINGLLETLQIKDYVLAGHSMGAKIVCYAAQINNTSRPSKLVLIAPSSLMGEKFSGEDKSYIEGHPDMNEAITSIKKSSLKKLREKALQHAVNERLSVHKSTWDWWWHEGRPENISDRIRGLNIPTYVICAKKDPVMAMDKLTTEVLPFLSKPKITVFGRCGHLIPLESPRKLAKRLNRILLRQKK